MSLQLGELSIALQLDNDRFRQQLANTKRELEGLPPVAQREVRKISRTFEEEGRQSGGTLAKGINAGLIRNSPLIAAAVAGALAAGAPLVLAGATTMFAGVGGIAAAQTVEVRQAWTEMGHAIRDGAVQDASVLVPAYTQMAEKIGAAFQDMRPQIRDAFADSVPLVDTFTDGILALAENAMPGFTRAVAAAGPVMDGLKSFLSSTGTGLTGFLDSMSSHSPAAGAAFASLGDIMGDLLPILGELLGQGAELAADVLPAVAQGTGLVLDVLQALGPALPAIVGGFAAFKIASVASLWLTGLSGAASKAATSLAGMSWQGELAAIGVNKAGSAVATIGKALPAVGIALGVAGAAMAMAEAQTAEWADALLEGGLAAQKARAEMSALAAAWGGAAGAAASAAPGARAFAEALGMGASAGEDAKAAADALFDSMSPLEQAEQRVTQATNWLQLQLKDYGAGSDQAAGASRALESAQGALERKQGALEQAIHGVTSAMIAQAQQALAAASADYAYRQSLEGIDDQIAGIAEAQRREAEAATAVNEARRIHGASSAEAAAAERDHAAATEATSDAIFGLEGTLLSAAEAAGRLAADALPASASELQRNQAAAAGSLAELERLRDEMGANFPPALQQAIDRLRQSGVALTNTGLAGEQTASQIRDLGFAVTEVPGQKFVKIDAPTAPQVQQLKDLGYHVVNLPNGDVYVAANTADAEAALAKLERDRTANLYVNQIVRASTRAGGSGVGGAAMGGPVPQGLAIGGPVYGPGGPMDDLVQAIGSRGAPFRLSDGEHVLTAREVRAAGGHGAIMDLRRDLLQGPRRASGAPVVSSAAPGVGGGTTSIVVTAHTSDERRIAKAIADEQRDREFLAGR